VHDGAGPPLPDGATLPASAEQPTVQLDDLLTGLDAPTRAALGALATDLGAATAGHGGDLDATVAGLAALAREGHGPLDVLAAQTDDLKALVAQTATLLGVLDQGEGQLARFVTSANRLSRASASRAEAIEETMRLLPGVLDAARAAGAPLRNLSGALAPLAGPLSAAGPDLAAAAAELGPVAAELRAAYPALGGVLDRAPATLDLTPGFAAKLSAIIPPAQVGLADLNPMLAFLAPYDRDLAAFVANVAQVFGHGDAAGKYVRTFVVLHEQSLKDAPVSTNVGPFDKSNAYPAPGSSARPGPFVGNYPRVAEQPSAP
jgi:phospholipid/cholesterol/gamma-HCH transport system substrate-binding protein